MTVQEAKANIENLEKHFRNAKRGTALYEVLNVFVTLEDLCIAIECMEEVEQYRVFKEIFGSQFSSEALKLLNDKEEFTKWLERGKWNARKCDELNKEVEQYRALGTLWKN